MMDLKPVFYKQEGVSVSHFSVLCPSAILWDDQEPSVDSHWVPTGGTAASAGGEQRRELGLGPSLREFKFNLSPEDSPFKSPK